MFCSKIPRNKKRRWINITDFYNNPLIKKLTPIPQWGVSDENKKPLDAKTAVKTSFKVIKNYSYYNHGTTTLDKIEDAMPKDFKGNIALRLNFEKLHVIALDIEPEYDHEKWDPYFYWIPFDYMEYSMHHGIHGLIEIPKSIYSNPKLEKLFKQNNIEFLLKEDKRTKHIGVEFDINNHFITLTKNVIDPKNSPIEFNKELTGENKEKALLGFLLELNKKAKEKQTFDYSKLKGQKLDDYSETDLKNAKIISHNVFGYNRRRHAKINAENKIDKNTGEIDYSVIEWTFLCSLYGYYKQMQKDSNMISKLGNQLIGNPRKVIDDPKIQAFSMYYTAQNELTPRKKWNEKRHGLPWMLEQSHAVIQKMQQINKQTKK